MSHWNYRVLKRDHHGETEYVIVEAYYDDQGKLEFRTDEPMTPCGETTEELKETLEWMLLALTKPVIEE